jgi:hypothetical protein
MIVHQAIRSVTILAARALHSLLFDATNHPGES